MNYTMIGRVDEAERLVQDCYDRSCVVLGRDHSDTLECWDVEVYYSCL